MQLNSLICYYYQQHAHSILIQLFIDCIPITLLTLYSALGKTTEEEQLRYFVDGRGRWQGKKGRKNFWGDVRGKWGIVLTVTSQ